MFAAVGQSRSTAAWIAWMHSGSRAGLRLLKPAGNRLVSTGAEQLGLDLLERAVERGGQVGDRGERFGCH
jgi:hypothetical protein